MRLRARHDDEAGLTIVLVALTLITLLVFAAFVVDIGAVYGLRRQDQSAADSAALAAAHDFRTPSAAVASAKEYANDTLDTPFTDAEWNSCTTDPGALAVRGTGANCISFDSDLRRVRVRLPDQTHETMFGVVVGVDEMAHSAFAIAGFRTVGFGSVLPFGVTAAAGGGGHVCLKTGTAGAATPVCSGPDSGNFGFLALSIHGNDGRTAACGDGGTGNAATVQNIAIGLDHDLSKWGPGEDPHGTTDVNDEDCSNHFANYAEGNTGNTPNDLGKALFSGSLADFEDGLGPRFARGDYGRPDTIIESHGSIDDNPLWDFIPASLSHLTSDVPESCERNQFLDSSGNIDTTFPNVDEPSRTHILSTPGSGTLKTQNQMVKLMERCFAHYQGQTWDDFGALLPAGEGPDEGGDGCSGACTDPVFTLNSDDSDEPDLPDIQYTPRFGYVPQLVCTTSDPDGDSTPPSSCLPFDNGSNGVNRFSRFRAIYMHRICVGNNNCVLEYDPGFGIQSSGNDNRANSLTAFMFPDTMLPNGLAGEDAPFKIGVNRFVQLLR